MADTKTTTKRPSTRSTANVWTDEERAAMQESARERKAAARSDPAEERAAGEAEVQAKIAEMPEPDRAMAERIHAIVTSNAPDFVPRTYYGMPAYAQGRQDDLLLQAGLEVQGAVLDVRLPARREDRRRRHVAGRVRGDEADAGG